MTSLSIRAVVAVLLMNSNKNKQKNWSAAHQINGTELLAMTSAADLLLS